MATAFLLAFGPQVASATPVYEVVHAFGRAPYAPGTNGLTLGPDGYLWGTTPQGGGAGVGAIYRVKPDGSDWQTMYAFPSTGDPGGFPYAGMYNDGTGYLWGTCSSGGASSKGTVFKYYVATGVISKVADFGTGNSGSAPHAPLVPDGHGFYWGTTRDGGSPNLNGTIFKVNASTGAMTDVLQFSDNGSTNHGRNPVSGLASDGQGNLWGTAERGGTNQGGTVFKVNTATGVLTTLKEFSTASFSGNMDGFYPTAGLVNDGQGSMWGANSIGGEGTASGTVFKINIATGAFTVVVNFGGGSTGPQGGDVTGGLVSDDHGFMWGGSPGDNSIFKINIATGQYTSVGTISTPASAPGRSPESRLVYDGNTSLYGTTTYGGGSDHGTVFKVDISTGTISTLALLADYGSSQRGSLPMAAVTGDESGNLWGTTNQGGSTNDGTVFKLNPASGSFSTLVEFTDNGATNKGSLPMAGLVSDGAGYLWGTTSQGGSNIGYGTIFKVNAATGALTTMVKFADSSNPQGDDPTAALVPDGNGYLWGTTSQGGNNSGLGTVFKIRISDGAFSTVAVFSDGQPIKGDGPLAGLANDGLGYFWGMTPGGGASGDGTIFKIQIATGALATVVEFTGNGATNKGSIPLGGLVSDGNGSMWGTTSDGGSGTNRDGTIFKVNTTTGVLTPVAEFPGPGTPYQKHSSHAGLVSDGVGNFWGTTYYGDNGQGSVFKVNGSTGALTTVVEFTGTGAKPNSGSEPRADLYRNSDGNLYGTTTLGGPSGAGVVFRIRLGPTPATLAATAVTSSRAALHGTLNPNGLTTTAAFEWGTDPTLAVSNLLSAGSTSGSSPTNINATLTGLSANTTYYFRVRGQNAENSIPQRGEILSFTTPANTPPTITLNGANPLTFEAAATYTDAGATANDADDGPLSPVITSNTVVPNVPGTYAVTWKATDSLGASITVTRTVNVVDTVAPSVSVPANVTVEAADSTGATVTYGNANASDIVGVTSLTYSQDSGTVFPMGITTVQVTAKDAANNTSVKSFTVTVRDTIAPTLSGTFSPLTLVAGTPLPNYTLQANSNDAVSTPTLSQSPAPMSPTHAGTQHVTITARDEAGNQRSTAFDVVVSQAPVTAETPYVAGGPVPGAGVDPRIPSGATWIGFGPPAINASGQLAYLGKWAGGSGIFVDDALVLKVGESAAGVTFKSFKDPVLDDGGHVAFIATLAGVPAASDSVVAGNGHTGALEVLAREGSVAPDTGGAKFKSFSSVSIQGTAVGVTVFTGTLAAHTGAPATTTARDTAAWWQPAGSASVSKLIREGDPGFDATEKIKSFELLLPLGGSPGQGRGLASSSSALLQAAFTNKQQAQLLAANGTLTDFARTGDELGGPVVLGRIPHAQWSTMSLPSSDRAGSNISVLGVLKSGVAGITAPTAKGILVSSDSGVTWDPLARVGFSAPTLGLSVFSLFKDPVHSSTDAGVAFFATVKGGGVKATANDAIWWRPDSGTLGILVREGSHSPLLPASATWKSFPSLAYPGGAGPLFTAFIGGVKSNEDCGLYAVDSFGDLRELMRENQPLAGHIVKSFLTLTAIPGSAGTSRSFSTNGQVAALVTFTGGTSGVTKFHVP